MIDLRPTLRRAGPGGAALASRIVVAGWRDSYGGFLPDRLLTGLDRNPHHDEVAWRQAIEVPTARTWVVELAGRAVGVARLAFASTVPSTRSELTTLYIETEHQGRGIGSAVLHEIIAGVVRPDALPLAVCVLTGNTRGRRFYERHGAKVGGERAAFQWEGHVVSETTLVFVSLANTSIPGSA